MMKPRERTKNKFTKDGTALLAKVPHMNGDYLPRTVTKAAELLGGLESAFSRGDRVLLKPNFNCRYEMPLSTNLDILSAIIELLLDHGLKVSVGESSGKADGPTCEVVGDLGVLPLLARYDVPFIDFEEDQWIEMEVPGKYWKKIHVPKSIYEADKRVYAANMRCHNSARFSASLKLSVGWINMDDRTYLHEDRSLTEYKVAELNLGWQPDLVFVDGRRTTNTQSGRGPYIYPNVVMASGDMAAIDTEALRILKSFPGENLLDISIEEMGQMKTALEHDLGSREYRVVEAEANLETEQKSRF
jgi:uncharacterized protein (DUF362 family)